MPMTTIFDGLTDANLRAKPFPHVLSTGVVPDTILKELQASIPWEVLREDPAIANPNSRVNLPAHRALADRRVPTLWRSVLLSNSSPQAYHAAMRVFIPHIIHYYPTQSHVLCSLPQDRIGRRGVDDFSHCDVLMEAQLAINSPVVGAPSSIRGVHVDNPRKLFSALFYLRLAGDDTPGGDLELHRFHGRPGGFVVETVLHATTIRQLVIPYASNTLVVFVNTVRALHSVSPRHPGVWPRVFLNVIAEVKSPLYDIRPFRVKA